jgi:hypothetical protein
MSLLHGLCCRKSDPDWSRSVAAMLSVICSNKPLLRLVAPQWKLPKQELAGHCAMSRTIRSYRCACASVRARLTFDDLDASVHRFPAAHHLCVAMVWLVSIARIKARFDNAIESGLVDVHATVSALHVITGRHSRHRSFRTSATASCGWKERCRCSCSAHEYEVGQRQPRMKSLVSCSTPAAPPNESERWLRNGLARRSAAGNKDVPSMTSSRFIGITMLVIDLCNVRFEGGAAISG